MEERKVTQRPAFDPQKLYHTILTMRGLCESAIGSTPTGELRDDLTVLNTILLVLEDKVLNIGRPTT